MLANSKSATKQEIYLGDIKSQFEIFLLLEELYQIDGAYNLVFSHKILRQIEYFFDQIIGRYGYRLQISFTYHFTDFNPSRSEFP